MPRSPRICPDGVPQHIVNRGNLRAQIFREPADYLGFIAALADAAERTVVRLIAFCLMPNHWHLVLWPFTGSEISAYMQILMNSHIRDLQRRQGTSGTGHIYQGRYKNHPIESGQHLLNVCRYVEANAHAAGLVHDAQHWPWCSLSMNGPAEDVNLLSPSPVPRPAHWLDLVNRPQATKPIGSVRRDRPKVASFSDRVLASEGGWHLLEEKVPATRA
jgi:putative transposase